MAFYSGTDNNDDKNKVLITGVVGKLSQPSPDIIFRMNRLDDKVALTIDQVFAPLIDSVEIPAEWLSRIQTGYGSHGGYGGAAGNFRQGHNITGFHRTIHDEIDYYYGQHLRGDDDQFSAGGAGSKKVDAGAVTVPAVSQTQPQLTQQTPSSNLQNPPHLQAEAEEREVDGATDVTGLSEAEYNQMLLAALNISEEELVSMAKSPANVTAKTWAYLAEMIDNEVSDPMIITKLLEAHFEGATDELVAGYACIIDNIGLVAKSDAILVEVIKEVSAHLGAEGQLLLQNELYGTGV